MSTNLADCVRTYDAAFKTRAALRATTRIGKLFLDIARCERRIEDLGENLKAAQRIARVANRQRSRSHGYDADNRLKSARTRQNVRADASNLEARLNAARREKDNLERTLGQDPAWSAAQREYYSARHALLVAIAERDAADFEWRERKLRFIQIAQLTCDPDTVWWDVTSVNPRTVHLFYGGVDVPDGVGHGHIQLTMRGEMHYEEEFTRLPTMRDLLVAS